MSLADSQIEKLQSLANDVLIRRKSQQEPRRNAPKVDSKQLIFIGKVGFKMVAQTDRKLVLKVVATSKEMTTFERNKSLSWIVNSYEKVLINGWYFRIVMHKRNKITLKPLNKYIPTL